MRVRRLFDYIGAFLWGLGVLFLFKARDAQLLGKMLPGGHGVAPMTPAQAYIAGVLLIAAALLIFLAFRLPRR